MTLLKRRIFSGLLLSFCLISTSVAQPSIQRYFAGADFEFILEEEITHLTDHQQIAGFPVPVLEEAICYSYSRWQVRQTGTTVFRLEVFELLDPPGAFQLFTLWPRLTGHEPEQWIRSPVDIRLGQGEITFWKGNFFLRLVPVDDRNGLPFVEELIRLIPLENIRPVTVIYLPEEGRIADSVEFYLGATSLAYNPRFPEPLLSQIGFEDEIEIAYAAYQPQDFALFLVGYPTPALADKYFVEMQNELRDFFSAQGIFMKRSGVLVALFIGPEEAAVKVLSTIKYNPAIRWIDRKESTLPEEYRTFFGLLTQTFIGIGAFILLTLGAGLIVGLARYEFLQFFPKLRTRKDTIRLNLGEPSRSEARKDEGPR